MTNPTPTAPGSADQPLDKPALANDLRLACQRIARRVRFESTSELAPHLFSVLARVNRVGPQTPTQLAEHDRVSTPSMTRTLNALCERGLVEKQPHPHDGRQVLIQSTRAGDDVVQQTIAHRDMWMLAHIDSLDDDKLALLRKAADLLLEVSHA
ncbi:MarR family transcriptional regulator [Tessaracoccus lubricantis]|uniref:MarR family transcriptional regulator n=1 Tax=Tessaracoccus lubricantis TaxID=545543 RepID=A0ABP9F4R5_9ACTN